MLADGLHPTLFFSNSNIFPQEEAELRYEALLVVAKAYSLPVIREEWDHDSWLEAVSGLEGEREGGKRCEACFAYNLREASLKAEELGFSHFCTTLTVSRFKNSKTIFRVGEQFPLFEELDFKKKGGFDRSLVLSRELGLYRQHYCGCEFSIPSS
jgi:predicted adenine nucleotide alpha hydrolase (AANH) superfamily ATPase